MSARRFCSRFHGFPVLSCLISHAFFPGSLTRLFCPFPFVLPCFAPAAVPQVIPFQVSSPGPVPDFRFLSSASVLASHYSASVSSFPPSPLLPHSGFRSSRLRSRFPSFPFLSDPISRAFLPGSRTRLSVRFLSTFLASLPQLFHECLPSSPVPFVPFFSGIFRSASASFRSLPLSFRLLSLTVLSFPASCLRLTVASSVLRFFLSVSPFSTFFSGSFRPLLFRFPVLDLLLVSFRPALIHSRSRSSGDPLLNFFSGAGA